MSYIPRIKSVAGLSIQLAKADFKLRNEGSYLGIFWYLLSPLLMFTLLFFIFQSRLGTGIEYYALYLFLGIIMFNFFQSTSLEATKSLMHENVWLIKSINFPRESLIGAIVLRNLFSHLFEFGLFVVLFLFFNIPIINLLFYLIVLIFLVMFILGVSLILSSFTVYFADLDNIWTFFTRILWLGTPIFYTIGSQNGLLAVNLFNPLYYFITFSRDLIIYSSWPEPLIFFGVVFWSFFFLVTGILVFNKLKGRLAELI